LFRYSVILIFCFTSVIGQNSFNKHLKISTKYVVTDTLDNGDGAVYLSQELRLKKSGKFVLKGKVDRRKYSWNGVWWDSVQILILEVREFYIGNKKGTTKVNPYQLRFKITERGLYDERNGYYLTIKS